MVQKSTIMKKIFNLALPVFIIVVMNSCATVYKCGDPVPEKKPAMGKRMKAVVNERDILCTDLAASEKENAGLKTDLAEERNKNKDLTFQLNDLQGEYNSLVDQSLSETDKLSKALSAKSEELDAKEKLLIEREMALNEMKGIIARQDSLTRSLNSLLRNALLGFNSDELSVEIKNGKVYVSMSDKLLFKSGSSTVESKGQEALKLLGGVLEKNADIDILVEGHTDNVPIKTSVYKDNWDLSVKRATTVVRVLLDGSGIDPERLTASGRGEYLPVDDRKTADARQKNRRTEIILTPDLDELYRIIESF